MEFLDFILNIDKHLASAITLFGGWTYILLFLVIFAETGLVIAPFLPGDSLLFAVGTLAGGGMIEIWAAYLVVLAAAVIGDATNYWIGRYIGPRVFIKEKSWFFNKAYLEKTREFYKKYGGKTIIISRFLPLIRTFAPFVAGIGKMHYGTFFLYNIAGAFLWATFFTFTGYFFGGMPLIKENFEYAILVIVAISFVPMIIEYIKYKYGPKIPKKQLGHVTYEDIKSTFKEGRPQ